MLWSYTMSVPRAADVEKAISWAKRPRPGAPREACTGVLTMRRPDESTSRAMKAPSNTLAVPVRVNGLATTAPTPGDSTKIGGSKSRQSARRCGAVEHDALAAERLDRLAVHEELRPSAPSGSA